MIDVDYENGSVAIRGAAAYETVDVLLLLDNYEVVPLAVQQPIISDPYVVAVPRGSSPNPNRLELILRFFRPPSDAHYFRASISESDAHTSISVVSLDGGHS